MIWEIHIKEFEATGLAMDIVSPQTQSQVELWASPMHMSGDSQDLVRSTMQDVYEKMANQAASPSRRRGLLGENLGLICFPKRLSEMILKELNASAGSRGLALVELTELLFLHCRDQVFLQRDLGSCTEGLDSPAYVREQKVSLQRCMYLYSQVLFANADWSLNNREDKNCFETLYMFLSKVVQSCIQQTLETTMRGAVNISCQALVEEELGRLFRSPVFNSFNAQRAKLKEKSRAEAKESKSEGDREQHDSLDALLKQKAEDAVQASESGPKHSLQMQRRRDLREAACARSPMLAAVLPSARDKVHAVDQKSIFARSQSRCTNGPRKVPVVHLEATSAGTGRIQNAWAFCKERAPHLSYQQAR